MRLLAAWLTHYMLSDVRQFQFSGDGVNARFEVQAKHACITASPRKPYYLSSLHFTMFSRWDSKAANDLFCLVVLLESTTAINGCGQRHILDTRRPSQLRRASIAWRFFYKVGQSRVRLLLRNLDWENSLKIWLVSELAVAMLRLGADDHVTTSLLALHLGRHLVTYLVK